MINNKKKVSGVPVLTALALATLLTTQGVMAADVSFNLTAQPLANAITQVAQQGQLHVIFDESDVRNLRAPAISGNYSAQGALQQLLAGSGLELVASGKGYVVRPMRVSGAAAGSMVLPTTSVMGEAGGRAAVDNVMSAPQVVTSEEIRQRPTGNGNITELLRTNPAVQFSNSDNTSLTQGEIKPGAISIHGSSSYQNAYNLDGVSFNNDIDPASDGNGETITRIDSSDQGMYIDSRLIDSVTVFDNNIPVEFGGFTGGTLDVSSRRWRGENSAHAFYRETRSSWNKVFTDPDMEFDSSKNDTSRPARYQPKYNKQSFGGWFEAGITDNMGIVFSASQRLSDIPTYTTGGSGLQLSPNNELEVVSVTPGYRSQKRVSDNYFAKLSWDANERTSAHLSANYSAYTSTLFSSSVINSGYDNDHNGLSTTLQLEHRFDIANLDFTAGYQQLKDERTNDVKDFFTLEDYMTDWRNPQFYNNGGQGDLTTRQNSASAKGVLRFNEFNALGLQHSPNLGFELNKTTARYIRDRDYYRYKFSAAADDIASLTEASYITRFRAGNYEAGYTNYALFLDDSMQYSRLTVRPGVRLDRDDFVQKTNIAPRLSSSLDLFGTGNTVLIAGANRYYGRSMLTYALYEAQNAGMEHCYYFCSLDPSENDWNGVKDFEGIDSLKTPYNDELSFALQQQVMQSTWRLQYVHREGYDEVRSRTKYRNPNSASQARIRTFDNGGRSSNDQVSLSVSNSKPWELAATTHAFTGSLTWQQSKSNTPKDQGYAFFDPNTKLDSDKVWYDGKVINAADLPSTNFNSPWRLNLELTSEWQEYSLTFYNLWQWRSSRDQAVRYQNEYYTDTSTGTQMLKYEKTHFASNFRWDTKVTWQPAFAYGAGISIEVNNLLNKRNVSDTFVYGDRVLHSYDPGRQFWLQVSYDL
ncbi:TPA: TonB-dependent receptor [Yersinia enterocolitica]|uniref:secretin and TonB N-terminal domain-containing protein n=1 Tax=Yersinia enterocolitica TaxID=630 RepID=UPI0029695FD6|nr:TonB-dependent receptor [Yersinia enterocolitica]HDS3334032.1 TonB-dependent receptor [Yersinia enterocolitica subsp. palearctica]HDL6860408.1 TonB-dependent receptor [Yersinia enterocolitica]HDL6864356.1 TonB-dependent receptor [Yersinia enterocolitica]HDL6868310.1 TonB-dependent receptor [Yersinia enterocolitica]